MVEEANISETRKIVSRRQLYTMNIVKQEVEYFIRKLQRMFTTRWIL